MYLLVTIVFTLCIVSQEIKTSKVRLPNSLGISWCTGGKCWLNGLVPFITDPFRCNSTKRQNLPVHHCNALPNDARASTSCSAQQTTEVLNKQIFPFPVPAAVLPI